MISWIYNETFLIRRCFELFLSFSFDYNAICSSLFLIILDYDYFKP